MDRTDGPPPPTQPADDGHVHRRRSDPGSQQVLHRRWYDSTKAHIAIGSTTLALLAGAFGLGAAMNTWLTDVSATPAGLREHTEATRTWQRNHLNEHDRLGRRLDVLTEVVYCTMRSRTPEAADRCLSDATRSQLEVMTRNRR